MKYTYAYKDSDGKRHEESMDAASREEVFAALRANGIRPIKVVAADGSKANGEIRGIRKRVVATVVILTATIAGVAAFWVGITTQASDPLLQFENEQTRRYPIGDAAIIEKGILTGWSEVFPEEGERFFASFAIPGVKAGQRNTTVDELTAALSRRVEPSSGDRIEARQIKAMVEGMKAEARTYIAAGGSIVEYGKRLTERQDAEIAIYEQAKSDLEEARKSKAKAELVAYWEYLNSRLRNLGIKLLSLE